MIFASGFTFRHDKDFHVNFKLQPKYSNLSNKINSIKSHTQLYLSAYIDCRRKSLEIATFCNKFRENRFTNKEIIAKRNLDVLS